MTTANIFIELVTKLRILLCYIILPVQCYISGALLYICYSLGTWSIYSLRHLIPSVCNPYQCHCVYINSSNLPSTLLWGLSMVVEICLFIRVSVMIGFPIIIVNITGQPDYLCLPTRCFIITSVLICMASCRRWSTLVIPSLPVTSSSWWWALCHFMHHWSLSDTFTKTSKWINLYCNCTTTIQWLRIWLLLCACVCSA